MDISNCLLFFLSFLFSFLPFSTLGLSLPFNLRGRSWGINFIKYNASLMAWLGELNTIKCIWKLLAHCMTSVFTFWLFKKLYFHKLAAAPAKVLPSCLTLWTVALQAPLSMGFSRQEYWNELPFPPPGDRPDPGIELTSLLSPALAGRFFTIRVTWEALHKLDMSSKLLFCVKLLL